MTLDEILISLFPAGHRVERGSHGTWHGTGHRGAGGEVALIGIADNTPLGVDGAILLGGHVLSVIKEGGGRPILLLIDTASQNMTRRDELLGLNEYLAHLSKALMLAAAQGHRVVGVLYGHAAAGAFIATALSTQVLATLPGAKPSVMDLPSIARVTKLPLDRLKELAKTTPIFAPGVDPLFATGAVTEKWDAQKSLADQFTMLLERVVDKRDRRDEVGLERKGRLEAARIAQQVAAEANQHV
jgi:malonate decarboxylase gamma subunit